MKTNVIVTVTGLAIFLTFTGAATAAQCPQSALEADVVAIDHPIVFNRLGAQNVNWMMYALRHDVIDLKTQKTLDYTQTGKKLFAKAKQKSFSRGIALRPDLRPRPLVLRVAAGEYLKVRFTNLLQVDAGPHPKTSDHFSNQANPFNSYPHPLPGIDHPMEHASKDAPGTPGEDKLYRIDDQVASRWVGFHPQGLELVSSIDDDSSYVGKNSNSLVKPGETREYCFYAPHEGAYLVSSDGAVFGGEGTSGNSGVGLFGVVAVQPRNARFYRAQVTEEEMRLATLGQTPGGQSIIDYEKLYGNDCPNGIWCREGKAGKPVLNMVQGKRIMHGDINAIIVGPNPDGSFPASTYPLESQGKQNPTLPNRLEPFREFVSVFHDENAATQAFPYFFEHPELSHTLHGVRDAFMINYGSGGVGAEIIANRLQAGPMQDCLDCAYEEFFLSSFAVGDAAMLVDKPANLVISQCQPEYIAMIKDPEDPSGKREILNPRYKSERKTFCVQPKDQKATEAYYPHDPANVHHSYIGDFVKFRNSHSGKEQHIFHLHNHQWLFNPNDDNSNYIDAQGVGPGSGYTYEIAFGGSGNRNKTVGDAIFHCHFYPHFAQGMWYMWRNHDVFEAGTKLAISNSESGFHEELFGLRHGKPAAGSRALPDGEIIAGTPIPAIVPLPGKGMAVMPGEVTVQPRIGLDGETYGSVAKVIDRTKNPGFPFWVAGTETTVGSRPTTPPLDMSAIPGVVSGHDGGLPRHALAGFSAGGEAISKVDRFTAEKHIKKAMPVYYDEAGTDLERLAMDFHAQTAHTTSKQDMAGVITPASFITNGGAPVPGAPYNEPCMDDQRQVLMTGGNGKFFPFDGTPNGHLDVDKRLLPNGIEFGADKPRVYKGANIQLDVVFNKLGYHYPQQRILTLWEDVGLLLDKTRPPEPLVIRMNTFDCAMYAHTNLVPHYFYGDDYQITTPTDVIGQHIHLPKWDLTSADGGANGWNYEDGTFSPGMVRERIHAINQWNATHPGQAVSAPGGVVQLIPSTHPYFNASNIPGHQASNCETKWQQVGGDAHQFDVKYGMPGTCDWLGARTTLQRWFSDPIINAEKIHRGLGITFTHDHLGPSTHQQMGLYATMLTEPPGSEWRHNETGVRLYDTSVRKDGGPTSWQAVITARNGQQIDVDHDGHDDSHREFFLQFGDFQHAYLVDAYYGVDKKGIGWPLDPAKTAKPTQDSFRKAIHPSVRKPANPVFPDVIAYEPTCPGGYKGLPGAVYDHTQGQPPRPCAEAISADDVGMMVVNYRNEPIAARVYDPDEIAADGKKGDQAADFAGDLAYAFQTRTDRKISDLNTPLGKTPYIPLTQGILAGDPFTPIMRAYSGDLVRVKIQGGSHEHEHNGSINGLRWLQSGSGFGQAPHSGWRNAQNAGLSEQFTFTANITDYFSNTLLNDRMYQIDTSQDGIWSGVWGILRSEGKLNKNLTSLPGNLIPVSLALNQDNPGDHCPAGAPVRLYDVTAVLANQALNNDLGVTIPPASARAQLDPTGGTLIYNPRTTNIKLKIEHKGGHIETRQYGSGPLHDPTAILFVRSEDLDENGKLKPFRPVEPLVLRAAAGECIRVTLRNRLPSQPDAMPDLDGYTSLSGIVIRDPGSGVSSMSSFNNNLIRPSRHIGLHPQLVHYNVQTHDGNNVGINHISTIAPGETIEYQWYAGLLHTPATPAACEAYADPDIDQQYQHLGLFASMAQQNKPLRSPAKLMTPAFFRETVFRILGPNYPGTGIVSPEIKTIANQLEQATRELGCFESIASLPVVDELLAIGIIDPVETLRALPVKFGRAISAEILETLHKQLLPDEPISNMNASGTVKGFSQLLRKLLPVVPKNQENSLAEPFNSLLRDVTASVITLPLNTLNIITSRQECSQILQSPFREILKSRISVDLEPWGAGEPNLPLLKALPFIEHFDPNFNHAASQLDLPQIKNRVINLVPDIVALLSDTFLFETAGILLHNGLEAGLDQAYGWRKLFYEQLDPGLSRENLKLVQISGNAGENCRFVPVEFGGTNLTPPDRIKQGQKAAIGALIIEPEGATWHDEYGEQVIDRQNPGWNQTKKRWTRAMTTVSYPVKTMDEKMEVREFRDFALIHQKGLNLRYADGSAVANLAAEKEFAREASDRTAPEDAHDAGHMAINYAAEPMWFRFGLPPDAPFGREGFAGAASAWQAFSNKCCANKTPATGGTIISADQPVSEPYVPIMTVAKGQEMRIRALLPTGVGRASTIELHGHGWARDPYLAERVDRKSFPIGGRPIDWGVASKCIGQNPMAIHMGGQESISPMAHFDLVFPRAGGKHAVAGDYLWRDHGGFGITSGLWALIRVTPSPLPLAPIALRAQC